MRLLKQQHFRKQRGSMVRSVITGCGAYLPETLLTNDDLAKRVDTSDEWITERTGIRQRYIAAEGQYTSDLAAKAARKAMEAARITPQAVDLIVLATTTPDLTFPSTATKVQALLGVHQGAAFDIQAVCSGFIYALTVADNAIRCGQAKTAIVIGAETLSRIVDWTDRSTCVLFGDGAGALVLQASVDSSRGVIATKIASDGAFHDVLYVDGGVSSSGHAGKIRMLGREVYKHAVDKMATSVEDVLALGGMPIESIDFLVPHQANMRILQSVAKRLQVEGSRLVATVGLHANTSAASILLALEDAVRSGKLTEGKHLVATAIGGGLSWGSALITW